MAFLNAVLSARYAVGGSCVTMVLESTTEPAEKTEGGTLILCPATVIACRRTM
jgi:hypothetical protein